MNLLNITNQQAPITPNLGALNLNLTGPMPSPSPFSNMTANSIPLPSPSPTSSMPQTLPFIPMNSMNTMNTMNSMNTMLKTTNPKISEIQIFPNMPPILGNFNNMTSNKINTNVKTTSVVPTISQSNKIINLTKIKDLNTNNIVKSNNKKILPTRTSKDVAITRYNRSKDEFVQESYLKQCAKWDYEEAKEKHKYEAKYLEYLQLMLGDYYKQITSEEYKQTKKNCFRNIMKYLTNDINKEKQILVREIENIQSNNQIQTKNLKELTFQNIQLANQWRNLYKNTKEKENQLDIKKQKVINDANTFAVQHLIQQNKRLVSNVNQLMHLIAKERQRKNDLKRQLKQVISTINNQLSMHNQKISDNQLLEEDTIILQN